MLTPLDILYTVLAVILLPIGTLLSMVLYRIYKMMDRIDRLLTFAEKITEYFGQIEKIPLMIFEKFTGK